MDDEFSLDLGKKKKKKKSRNTEDFDEEIDRDEGENKDGNWVLAPFLVPCSFVVLSYSLSIAVNYSKYMYVCMDVCLTCIILCNERRKLLCLDVCWTSNALESLCS